MHRPKGSRLNSLLPAAGIRILIVDDYGLAREGLVMLLATHNHIHVVGAVATGSEAIDAAMRLEPSVVIMDLVVRELGGVDAMEQILQRLPQTRIVILSACHSAEHVFRALRCGASAYVSKEAVTEELVRAVNVAMLGERYLSSQVTSLVIEGLLHGGMPRSPSERSSARELARVTLDSIADAVVSIDVAGAITYLNSIAEDLTGWSRDEAIGHPLADVFRFTDAQTRATARNPMALTIQENRAVALRVNCVLIRRDGVAVPIEDSVAPIHDRRGAVTGAVMVFHDADAARAMTLKMSHLAQHDNLTDLPNRALLHDRLSEAITLSGRYRRTLAVLCLNLDRFKYINDSLGHAIGDRLLQSVTRRLFTCVRTSDTVGYIGGDAFAVLLWELRRPEDAALTAAKILGALRQRHMADQRELQITGSIGIAIYPDDGTEADTLMENAELAMYQAKQAGRDNYQFFKPDMNARATERQSLQDGLHHAIERQELALHYQPKLDLATREIIGAEALVRWRHPQRGLIPPAQFISIAEDCGLIVPIGRWVLREACRQMRDWQLAGLAPRCIAINVSPVELRAPGFVSGVRAILAETGLESRYLELELPETPLLDDTALTGQSRSLAEVLRELKVVGAQLALDDFGTRGSGVNHLKRLPIDTLKIDQSFVRDMTRNAKGIGIVIGLIGMGNCLHMRVLAEGVETREQLEILAHHGCPQGQGYYFSRPVPAEEFRRLLERDAGGTHLPDQIAFEGLRPQATHRLM
jgi:diguanylate cyclase (GGDEF)-like protein/PAS domain S-box-containing protein